MDTPTRTVFFHALVVSLAVAGLGAQNIVTNGDFESGNTTGWRFGGYTLNSKVDTFDTTGGGTSKCFNTVPGGQQTPGPYPPNWMEQDVVIVQGVVHEFRADIASSAIYAYNGDGGTIEAFVDGAKVATHAFGPIAVNTVERTRLCGRIVPTTSGPKKLRITFHRNYLAATNRTPTCYIDNIFLGRTQGPTVCFPGERKAGGSFQILTQGTAGYRFALFLAVGPANPPVQVPGWTGQWELANPSLPLVVGNLDTAGRWSFSTIVPAAAMSAKAWIQGAQAAPSSSQVVHMGYSQEVNIY